MRGPWLMLLYLSHITHYNPFYDPVKHDSPLLPAAAALAPTIWPQFHLRWACPSEARAGELEPQWRSMSRKYAEMSRAKDIAELKAREMKINIDSLAIELQKEKQVSSSASAMARRACKESRALKRAVQSLGCKVHFSSSSSHVGNSEGSVAMETREGLPYFLRRESNAGARQPDEKDLSISIVAADESCAATDKPISHVCEKLCPFRIGGGCNWPDAGCAQLRSQFVGLKANFDAFDRLSIYDRYF